MVFFGGGMQKNWKLPPLAIPHGYFNDFQIPPNYLIISPMELALKTNISAIPTCISNSFSVCLPLYTVCSERTQVWCPHEGFPDKMSHRTTATQREMLVSVRVGGETTCPQRRLPGSRRHSAEVSIGAMKPLIFITTSARPRMALDSL